MPSHVVSEPQRGLLTLFDREGVRFLVIGGHAVRVHGFIRPTQDLDLWVACSRQNAKKIARGFKRIGAPLPKGGDWVTAFVKPNALYAYPSVGPGKEADILTSIEGMDFDACYSRSIQFELAEVKVRIINLGDLIASKQISAASGNDEATHARDNSDIEALSVLLEASNYGKN